jgi:hypothetical protein
MNLLSGLFIFLYVVIGIYLLVCYGNIAKKAGYSFYFGFLMVIPIVNFVILGILAFETWPILKNTDEYKAEKISRLKKELADLTGVKETTEEDEKPLKQKRVNAKSEEVAQSEKPIKNIEYMRYSPDILSCTTCKFFDIDCYNQRTPWCQALVGPSMEYGVCSTFKSKKSPS